MGGFAVYSAFFATMLGLLQRWGWEIRLRHERHRGYSPTWRRDRTGGCAPAWAREEEVMPEVEEIRALVEKAA